MTITPPRSSDDRSTIFEPRTDKEEADVHLLLAELERADSERHNNTTMFASLVGVVLLAAGGYLAVDSRQDAADWLWAAMAVIPILILAYVVAMMAQEVVQSYYCREIERRLVAVADTLQSEPSSLLETVNAATTGSRRGILELRLIHFFEYVTVTGLIVFGAVSATLQIENLVFRSSIGFALLVVFVVASRLTHKIILRGGETWNGVKGSVVKDLASAFPRVRQERAERRLISYLIVPRPNELLVKGVMLHLTSGIIGALLSDGRTELVPLLTYALVSFTAFEFLVYQARYMMNDRIGTSEDQASLRRKKRRRLPPLDHPVRTTAFQVAVVVRIGLAVPLVFLLPSDLRFTLAAALAACFLLAGAYERLRAGIGRAGKTTYTPAIVALLSIVGLSYAIRAGVGVHLGSDGGITTATVALIAATFYLSGTSTVLMAWTLEATEHIAGRTRMQPYIISHRIGSKLHLLPLARSAGFLPPGEWPTEEIAEVELRHKDEAVLKRSSGFSSPWNWTFVAGMAAGAAAGWSADRPNSVLTVVLAACAGGLAAAIIVRYPATNSALLGGAIAWAIYAQTLSGSEWFIPVPAAAIAGTYAATRSLRYVDTIALPDRIRETLHGARRSAVVLVQQLAR